MIRTDSATAAETFVFSHERSTACTSWAWAGDAVLPVPMAHTGSYATTILSQFVVRSAYACGNAKVTELHDNEHLNNTYADAA